MGLTLLPLAGCQFPRAETAVPTATAFDGENIQTRTFEAFWNAVRANYVHYPAVEDDWEAFYDQHAAQVGRYTPEEFMETIEAAVAALPEGAATWESREERIERERADSPEYEGIGAFIGYRDSPEPHVVLLAVVPDSPAEAAGLSAHDSILAIDGEAVQAEEGIRAVERIRGPSGSEVVLSARTPGEELREVSVQRASLVATGEVLSARLEETGLGYILLPPTSYEGMIEDFLAHLQGLIRDGAEPLNGLILDLRVASAGISWPLEELMSLFLDGSVGEFSTAAGPQPVQVTGQDLFESQSVPLVLLIGPDTQGFPEVLAAGIQAAERGTLIGLPTEGSVEGSRDFPLPDGSVVYISTVSYISSAGEDVGLTGVEPDHLVEADWDEVTAETDAVIEAAIESLAAEGP
jgi:carboxyl-terminal processing protease